jgi:ribosomal protein S3AE
MEQDLQTELNRNTKHVSFKIQSVSGAVLTENYITLNANGTEANQQNAVFILTDSARNLLTERTISIKFTVPVSTSDLE